MGEKASAEDLKVAAEVQASIEAAQKQSQEWLAEALKEEMRSRGYTSTKQVEALSNDEINGEGGFISAVEERFRERIRNEALKRQIPRELAETRIGSRVELNKLLKQFGAAPIISTRPRE